MKKLFITILFAFPVIVSATHVLVEVDTMGESVNAIEGMVFVKNSSVGDIRIGGSSVLIWIERPTFDSEVGAIRFSGITPGGFSGKRELFVVEGGGLPSDISFGEVVALKNDGKGTEVSVLLSAMSAKSAEDFIAPEPFDLYFSSGSPDIFDGEKFISFVTQDKGSGVARYEVAETFVFGPSDTKWKEVQSPYQIVDNLLIKKVYVRATDMKGNYTVSSTALPNRIYVSLILAIIILASCTLLLRKYFR